MLREATYPPAAVNVLDVSSESMAAFQVFTYGRFWVFTEAEPTLATISVMNAELLKWWEQRAAHYEQEWKKLYANNKTLGPLVYWRDVVPYKNIVRAARLKADQPICWGATDCLERPVHKCAAGKHEVCPKHVSECFWCRTETESPQVT